MIIKIIKQRQKAGKRIVLIEKIKRIKSNLLKFDNNNYNEL